MFLQVFPAPRKGAASMICASDTGLVTCEFSEPFSQFDLEPHAVLKLKDVRTSNLKAGRDDLNTILASHSLFKSGCVMC